MLFKWQPVAICNAFQSLGLAQHIETVCLRLLASVATPPPLAEEGDMGAGTADPIIEKLQGGECLLSVAVAKLRRK